MSVLNVNTPAKLIISKLHLKKPRLCTETLKNKQGFEALKEIQM